MELPTGRTIRWIAGLAALALLAVLGFTLSRFAGEAETGRADGASGQKKGVPLGFSAPPGLQETLAAKNAIAEDTPAGWLVAAARAGDTDRVRELLADGVPPDAKESRNGHRVLHQAAEAGEVEVVEALLAAGAEPNGLDGAGLSPLMRAALTAALPVAERLLAAGAEVNAQSSAGTALTHLVGGSFLRGLQGKAGESAAARRIAELEFARMLFDRGADPNLRSHKEQDSPLKVLAVTGNAELLALFVERGARATGDPDLALLSRMPGQIGEVLRTALSSDPEDPPPTGPASR